MKKAREYGGARAMPKNEGSKKFRDRTKVMRSHLFDKKPNPINPPVHSILLWVSCYVHVHIHAHLTSFALPSVPFHHALALALGLFVLEQPLQLPCILVRGRQHQAHPCVRRGTCGKNVSHTKCSSKTARQPPNTTHLPSTLIATSATRSVEGSVALCAAA